MVVTVCCCYNYYIIKSHLTIKCINCNVNRFCFEFDRDAKMIIYNIVTALDRFRRKGAFLDKVVPLFRLLNSYIVFKYVVLFYIIHIVQDT